jgi:hypothetical protein
MFKWDSMENKIVLNKTTSRRGFKLLFFEWINSARCKHLVNSQQSTQLDDLNMVTFQHVY